MTRILRQILGGIVLTVLLMSSCVPTTQAQSDQQCFEQTGFCISGRIRDFWNQNGGLSVFGYPISAQAAETAPNESQPFQAQWFERNRLELHPEHQAPYDVQIGRLGAERLDQEGRNWFSLPKAPSDGGAQADCQYFGTTGHRVCGLFLDYFQQHSLAGFGSNADGAASLALFGLPISEATMEMTGAGTMVMTQWFERARMELHPENAPPYNVELGLLGNEVRQATVGPAHPSPPAPQTYTSQETPADVLASFYNAINLHDYRRAYGYWEIPPSSYEQFAQGYAATTNVQAIAQPPTFIDAGAGNLHASIPTVLLVTQHDGSQQTFAGCYSTHKVTIRSDVWHLTQAQIAPVDASASIPTLLAQACAASGVPAPAQTSYANQNTAVDLLASFYNAINRQEYQRAYGYWETPPTSYDQFAQGYANTASVQLIMQLPVFIDVGAGNTYGRLPTVLIAIQRDGSQQMFYGCYMTHKVTVQPDAWHIAGATIILAPTNQTIPALLTQACPSL